jgi:hypothetical protein
VASAGRAIQISFPDETLVVWKSLLAIGILRVKETYTLGLATSPGVPLKRRQALIEKISARR